MGQHLGASFDGGNDDLTDRQNSSAWLRRVVEPDVLLDVMLPVYRDGPLVRETIESVLAQDDPRWRLTVVDDGANDDLKCRLAELGDARVSYVANKTRLGINRNFQRCVDQSTAKLVVILGADDRLLPDFVARVYAAAWRYPDAAFFHTGAVVIDEHGERALPLADRVKRLVAPRAGGVHGGEKLATSLLHGNWMYFPSVVFRRNVLVRHGFRDGYDIVLDLDLYLRILLGGGQAVLFDRPAIEYRRHAASLSTTTAGTGTRFAEERAYFAEVAAELTSAGWHRAARAARWHLTSRLHAAVRRSR